MQRRVFAATPLFLAAACAAGVGGLRAAGRLAAPGREVPVSGSATQDGPRRLVRTAGTAFGTTISLAALEDTGVAGPGRVHAALRAALREVQQIDALMSLYRPDSQLSVLNRTGRLDGAHPHLLRNLDFALRIARLSGGAFDPTVQPLWELFADAKARGGLPDAQAIDATRRRVDYRALRVEGDRVRIDRPGARVTLNSLAQGYAVDVVLDSLRAAGVDAALVDTGEFGNLGRGQQGGPWRVGIQHPRDRAGLIAAVGMDGRAMSTSGDYATCFSADFRHHHIFDPATGRSPPGYSSTVVLEPSGMVADGLSTALMVLDRRAGGDLMRAFPDADALWVDKAARVDATAGVPLLDA